MLRTHLLMVMVRVMVMVMVIVVVIVKNDNNNDNNNGQSAINTLMGVLPNTAYKGMLDPKGFFQPFWS